MNFVEPAFSEQVGKGPVSPDQAIRGRTAAAARCPHASIKCYDTDFLSSLITVSYKRLIEFANCRAAPVQTLSPADDRLLRILRTRLRSGSLLVTLTAEST